MAEADTTEDPWPFLAPFFTFVSAQKSNSNAFLNLKYICKLCIGPDKTATISCQSCSYGNLKKHIQRKHGAKLKEFEELLYTRSENKKKTTQPGLSQPAITNFMHTGKIVTQSEVNQKITTFIINSGQAFSLVREESFIELIQGLQPGKKVLCYETLMGRIKESFYSMKANIKNEFLSTKYICTTSDLWSDAKKSFLGVTAHTLNNNLERRSFALACRRLTGSHTHDVLAEALESILVEFNIQYKVVGMVTDNGSNFCKAFRVFGPEENATEDSEQDEEGDDLTFADVSEILEEATGTDYHLPPHFRCASHTLNLIASKDAEAALKSPKFAKLSRATFGKLQTLWNKQNRSTVFADQVQSSYNLYFLIPVVTRWNSTYHAVERVRRMLNQDREAMDSLLASLNIPPFTPGEASFISEFCQVMKPFAQALDVLQGDKNIFLGYLLPTLSLLKEKLEDVATQVTTSKPLAEALLKGLNERFQSQFEDKKMIVSAVYLPAFKLTWMNDKEKGRDLLLNEMKAEDITETASVAPTQLVDDEDQEGFFPKRPKLQDSAEEELGRFLSHPSYDLVSVKDYRRVFKVFLKYNTILPSSASCERLFSTGKHLFRRNRHKLKDENFEMQLLLSMNNKAM